MFFLDAKTSWSCLCTKQYRCFFLFLFWILICCRIRSRSSCFSCRTRSIKENINDEQNFPICSNALNNRWRSDVRKSVCLFTIDQLPHQMNNNFIQMSANHLEIYQWWPVNRSSNDRSLTCWAISFFVVMSSNCHLINNQKWSNICLFSCLCAFFLRCFWWTGSLEINRAKSSNFALGLMTWKNANFLGVRRSRHIVKSATSVTFW